MPCSIRKKKSLHVKIVKGIFPYPFEGYLEHKLAAYVTHAMNTESPLVKYSCKSIACSAGDPRSADVIPLIRSELILSVEAYSSGRE